MLCARMHEASALIDDINQVLINVLPAKEYEQILKVQRKFKDIRSKLEQMALRDYPHIKGLPHYNRGDYHEWLRRLDEQLPELCLAD